MASPSTRPQNERAPRDFRQEVTDSIVQMLEKGVAPWQKPWESNGIGYAVQSDFRTPVSRR